MNQMTKTMLFVGVATAAALLAYGTRGTTVADRPASLSKDPLFPTFKDPLTAKSLKIVRFDETLASLKELEARESNGLWTLPSHDGYPADAENRVRDATTAFVDLIPTSVVGDREGDHPLYGVVEPSADKSSVGDQGVGTLVNVKDASGGDLVNLVIGKEVKDNPGLRYVRRPGQSMVYIAKVDPKNLPVKFEDWIEKDLLKLNAWDIRQLVLKDYSFQVAPSLTGTVTDYDQRLEVTLTDDNGTWKLDELRVAQNDELQPSQLQENEELNSQRLNSLKEALDGLEIVNVERKPAHLREDLRADQGFANDQEGIRSLIERGFYPVQMPSGEIEVLSADGEVVVRTKEGVEYVLRFGGVQGVDTEGGEGQLNRFLLVTARVDQSQFPEPELELVPQTIEDLQPAATLPAPAGAVPELPTSSSVSPPQSLTTRYVAQQDDAPAETPVADPPAAETATTETPTAETPAAQTPAAETPAAETPAAETPAAETPAAETPAAETPAAPALTAEELKAKLQAEQERITKDNQRKIDERKDKLAKAQKKVQELNFRFADWYYVISEEVYKKVHLGQADLIQEKGSAEQPGISPDVLRSLESQGLPGQGLPGQGLDP